MPGTFDHSSRVDRGEPQPDAGAPLGLVSGTDLRQWPPFDRGEERCVETDHGPASVIAGPAWVLILRHGTDGRIPPHGIAHRTNIAALRRLGVQRAVAFCSVGSLKAAIRPGDWVVPDDYGQFGPPPTLYETIAVHATPGLSRDLARRLVAAVRATAGQSGAGERCIDGGTYWQTSGPRLETRAEVRLLSRVADVVGMTFASEATLCNEAGIHVAALCRADNMANGLGGLEALDAEAIAASKLASAARTAEIAARLVAEETKGSAGSAGA